MAHGFVVLSDSADFLYKATDYYAPEFERTILWNDPDLGIEWPLRGAADTLCKRMRQGRLFAMRRYLKVFLLKGANAKD